MAEHCLLLAPRHAHLVASARRVRGRRPETSWTLATLATLATLVLLKCSEGGARCRTSPILCYVCVCDCIQNYIDCLVLRRLWLSITNPLSMPEFLFPILSLYLMSIGSSLGSSIGKHSRFLGPSRSPIFPPTDSPSPAFVVHRSDGWGPWQSFGTRDLARYGPVANRNGHEMT